MFSPIFVFFIAFMLASAFSLDGMLRQDQNDASAPSPAKTKAPHSKKSSALDSFDFAQDRLNSLPFLSTTVLIPSLDIQHPEIGE